MSYTLMDVQIYTIKQRESGVTAAMTDEQLVFMIVSFGSDKAKERLILRYYDHIYAFAYRRVGSADDAYDAAQEIFIRAMNALPTFDKHRASFKTWLYAVASNYLRDCFKRQSAEGVHAPIDEAIPSNEHFEEVVERRALAAQIMDYLEKSDYCAYQIVELKIFGDMTFEEIGAMLQLSPNTVKTRYYTAVKKCRKEFSP